MADQIDPLDPTTLMSPTAMQNMFTKMQDRESATMGFLEDKIGPLNELTAQAVNVNKTFQANVSGLMSEQEQIEHDLVRSLAMPEKVGKLFSLFGDQTYNPNYQKARAATVSSKINNEKYKLDASMNVIKLQEETIKEQLSTREHMDNLISKNISTIITGVNSMRQNDEYLQKHAEYVLGNSYSSKDLAGFAEQSKKTGKLTIKGKEYTTANIGAAVASKQAQELGTQQAFLGIQQQTLGNQKAGIDMVRDGINAYVAAMPLTVVQQKLTEGKDVTITNQAGHPMNVPFTEFASIAKKRVYDDKDVRAYVAGLGTKNVEFTNNMGVLATQGDMLLAMPDMNPAEKQRLMPKLIQLKKAYNDSAEALTVANSDNGPPLTDYQINLLHGELNEPLKAVYTSTEAAIKTARDEYAKTLPPVAKATFEDYTANGGKVNSGEVAANQVATAVVDPMAYGYGGHRALLNEAMSGALRKIYPRQDSVVDKDGKIKAGVDIGQMLSQVGTNLGKDKNFAFLQVDNQFKTAGGFKGAVQALDMNEIYRQSMVQFAQQYKSVNLGEFVGPDGNWAPNFAPALNAEGPVSAISNALASIDVMNIADGAYQAKDSLMQRFHNFTVKQFQDGKIGLPLGDLTDAATDRLAYGRDRKSALRNMLTSASQSANHYLQQQLVTSAQTAGPGDTGGGREGQMSAKPNDPLNRLQRERNAPQPVTENPWMRKYLGYSN